MQSDSKESVAGRERASPKVRPRLTNLLLCAFLIGFAIWSELDGFSILGCLSGVLGVIGIFLGISPVSARQFLSRAFLKLNHARIENPKLQLKTRDRFEPQLIALESSGFEPLFYMAERFSWLSIFLVLPALTVLLMKLKGEVIFLEARSGFVIAQPVLVNREAVAYADLLRLGVRFHTVFQDGTTLTTTNFGTGFAQGNITRLSYKNASIANTWANHHRVILDNTVKGNPVKMDLSVDAYLNLV
jgi:hypothetical protein